jgi:hypothetical protein
MTLFNKKLLQQQVARFNFPSGKKLQQIQNTIAGWQKSIKDGDLNKTKETSIQGLFLVKFFDEILGYPSIISGKNKWFLIPEPKTEVDAQEADGSLGIFTKDKKKTLAVIELKDAKTSLDKKQSGRVGKMTPVEQAFNYLNKFDGCKWAIVSNFREIRIYSKMRGQGFYEKFDIIDLHQEQEFKKFYYILNKANLIDEGKESVIEVLAKNTTTQEENITKKFYEHYKEIRIKLLNHLLEHNPKIGNLVLVEKTQKLLDRFIFTLVCEDSSTLLPAHLVKKTYERAFQSFALSDSDQRAWAEFKGLFHAIDKGNKRVVPPINAYNGGLFQHDEVLDNLIIKDEIFDEIIKLTDYDFESELNVNVLGHIFEQSISDLEEIREAVYLQLEGGGNLLLEDGSKLKLEQSNRKVVLKNGKRKKMGIFYTPEYITKYIVENTVGKYLEEHPDKLENIKILDPACGSGAFLNQAHSFLLNEYKVRTEEKQLEKSKKGELLTLWDTNLTENDKTILLNNLFGVDLSPESVDITKLALWLKTAKATEPLQNLDNNIKCGNSLIDDPKIAGERAFDWKKEYKDIVDKGGFDVIVGNPPYVQLSKVPSTTDEMKSYLIERYSTSSGRLNTFGFFILLGMSLLQEGGYLSFIIPNTILTQDYYEKVRKFILDKGEIIEIVNYSEMPFQDAVVENVTLILKKKRADTNHLIEISNQSELSTTKLKQVNQGKFLSDDKHIFDIRGDLIAEKIDGLKIKTKLSDICNINQAIALKGDKNLSIIDDKNNNGEIYPLLNGRNISRYSINFKNKYLIYDLKNIHSCKRKDIFLKDEKIFFRRVGNKIIAAYDNKKYFALNTLVVVTKKDKTEIELRYILALLNSKIMNHYYTKKYKSTKKVFSEIQARSIGRLPIIIADDRTQKELSDSTIKIGNLRKKLEIEKNRLLEILVTRFKLKQTVNLTNFHQLGWNELVEEIEKQKVKMDLNEEDKLSKWFNEVRKQLLKFEAEIQSLEQSIDKTLFKIYGLNAEEIKLIENDI